MLPDYSDIGREGLARTDQLSRGIYAEDVRGTDKKST